MPAAVLDLTAPWQAIVDTCVDAVATLAAELGLDVADGRLEWARNNIKPALRMAAAGFVADALGGLTIGTSNAIEYFLGYFSIRGDAVADRQPLRDLTKGEVRAVAAHGGFPDDLVARTPSAGLWPGQTDENELGFGYDDADRFFLWLLARHSEAPVLDTTLTVLPDAADALLARPDVPIPLTVARLIIARNSQTAFKRRSGDLERLLVARGLLTG
jgi:NAD+ synthase